MDLSLIEDLLKIGSGIFWSLAYILIIRQGFKDRTLGMPLAALCANLSWEFIFSFVYPRQAPQLYINTTWFLLDVVILYQALRFGSRELRQSLAPGSFYPTLLVSLVLSFLIILGISVEFQNWNGMYAAFGQNLMMSVLFVTMLRSRDNVSGQSMYIAIFKMVGTLLPSIMFYMRFPNSLLLNTLYIGILLFDLIYIAMLYARYKQLGLNPWRSPRAISALPTPHESGA